MSENSPQITSMIGPLTYRNLSELAVRVDEWVKSPEGKASMEKTAKSIREMLEEAEANQHLDNELLLKPMTI